MLVEEWMMSAIGWLGQFGDKTHKEQQEMDLIGERPDDVYMLMWLSMGWLGE